MRKFVDEERITNKFFKTIYMKNIKIIQELHDLGITG